jgi:DNA-binding response OmpR family regulator
VLKEMRKKILLLLKGGLRFESMIKGYLQKDGYEVDIARSGNEVLEKLRRSLHFLLIVEQDTYEMDCLELFLNVQDIQTKIPVLFLGSMDQQNKAEIVRLGGIYLEPPIGTETLREAISSVS